MAVQGIKRIDSGAWYAGSWSLVNKGMISEFSATIDDLKASMTRMEVAYAICKTQSLGVNFENYQPKSNPFSDLKERDMGNVEDKTDLDILNACYSDPTRGIPSDYYKAILMLNELGIMSGMGDGTVQPFKAVTRAEVLVLIDSITRIKGANVK